MTDKLQPSNLDNIGDDNKSWSWPSELKSLSDGRIKSTKTEADEVETHLPINDDEVATAKRHEQETAEQIEQSGPVEPATNPDNEVVKRYRENSSSQKRKRLASKSIKGRKLKSKVWKEFEKFEGEDGNEWAMCKHCDKKFDGSSKKGTTHLNNHLKRCKARKRKPTEGVGDHNEHTEGAGDHKPAEGVGDRELTESGAITTPVLVEAKPVIEQDLKQLDVTRMVIKNWVPSLSDMRIDIMKVFREEQEKVHESLDARACRFSLSIKWFMKDYYFIVVHFIDDDWEMKKKIIDFQRESDFENFDDNFINALQDSLLKWNLDKNVCSIVRTEGKKEGEFNEINDWLSERGSLPFCGQWLTVDNWLVDILLHSIRKEAKELAEKITELFDYVCRLPSSSEYYWLGSLLNSSGSITKCSWLPSWFICSLNFFRKADSFREKFAGQEWTDPAIKSRNLSEEEWDKTTAIYNCLGVLISASRSLIRTKHTTANVYFPKVCDIYLQLLLMEKSENYHVRNMASLMRAEFFKKYWTSYSLFLAIAAVLDPRFKMDIVKCWYTKIYDSEADAKLNHLNHNLTAVFNVYCAHANSSSSCQMLDELGRPYLSSDDSAISQKSELDRYLDEPKFPSMEEFNVLLWWRINTANFPTLARMAREFLAIPISSTISEAQFFMKTKIDKLINNVRQGNLDFDDLLRAFVCTKCWLSIE